MPPSTFTSPVQANPLTQHPFLPQSSASAPFLHVHGYRENDEVMGLRMPPRIKSTKQEFSGQGMISIFCQTHSVPSTGATNTYKCTTHSPCSRGLKSMNAPILCMRNDSNPTQTQALYMAFLVQPVEIPKAGLFPLKEEKTKVLKGEEMASVVAEVGPDLRPSLLLCRCPQRNACLWVDAGPQGYHPPGTKLVVTLQPQCCLPQPSPKVHLGQRSGQNIPHHPRVP